MSAPTAVVVDASVVLKWVLPEPGRAEALALLDGFETGGLDLFAPRSLLEEVASALAKRCRRRELTPAAAEQAWGWVEARCPLLVDGPSQVAAALKLALRLQLSLWDSLYLSLAIARRCDLVTADDRLHRAVARNYPFVRRLGEI